MNFIQFRETLIPIKDVSNFKIKQEWTNYYVTKETTWAIVLLTKDGETYTEYFVTEALARARFLEISNF